MEPGGPSFPMTDSGTRRLSLLLSAALLTAPLTGGTLSAQTIAGRVVDAATHQPISGATIGISEPGGQPVARAVTRLDGTFRLRLAAGEFRLTASRLGYAPLPERSLTLQRGDSVFVELPLETEAVSLEPVTVTARAAVVRQEASFRGAIARRLYFGPSGTRRVLLGSDAEFRGATRVGEVLRWLPPSGRCRILFLDGRVESEMAGDVRMGSHPDDYLAIEWYQRWHDAPLSLRDSPPEIEEPFRCSVVALWSR